MKSLSLLWAGWEGNIISMGVVTKTRATVGVMLVYFFTFKNGNLICCWKYKIFSYCKILNNIETCELIWKIFNE
jgi:hypothetical protein